jgi:lipoyl(octanoyl) transferase
MSMQTHFLGRVEYLPTYAAMQEFTAARSHQYIDESTLRPKEMLHNQLWICEHLPVFTQGLAGKPEHLLLPGDIPVVQTNRGGQVTYHGPGQVVAYPLVNLKAAGYYVKEYVFKIEEAVIKTLATFNITGHRVRGAPGIYVRTDAPGCHARLLGADGLAITEAALALESPQENSHRDKVDLTPIKTPINQAPFKPNNIGKIAALGIKVSRHFTYHGVALNVAMDLEPFSRINPCGYTGLRTVDMASLGVAASWDEVAQVFARKLGDYLTP